MNNMNAEQYDVYYCTGGGAAVYGGADVWVNNWLQHIPDRLIVKPVLLIHRKKPDNRYLTPISIEHYWESDNTEIFYEIAKGARRINILHGYYVPQTVIEENKSKLHSACIHVSLDLSFKAASDLNIDKLFLRKNTIINERTVDKTSVRHSMQPHRYDISLKWEEKVMKWTKHCIWIGIDKTPLHDKFSHIHDITNYYEFKRNKPLVDNSVVGFAARCETRKCPHFLDNIESLVFTNPDDFETWRQLGFTFSKTKVIKYNHLQLNNYLEMDSWGISHSCFISEPFGYSIFEAVDYGKLPVLHTTWCTEYDYPYRAESKGQFEEVINEIKKTKYSEKKYYFYRLREYLKNRFKFSVDWINNYLEIYNEPC
jgi:hypothetical protein